MASETIRVLLVEDDPTDAEFTRAMLGQFRDVAVRVEWAATAADGLARLRAGDFDVGIVDYLLDTENGLDLIREAARLECDTPLILLTGRGSRDIDLEAQEAGAADYLVKGRIDPDSLERAVRYTLERARALAALRESETRFRGLFDHLPIGVYRCTPDGGFLDANPALVQLLGRPTPETLRDRYAASFYVHATDLSRFRGILDQDGIVRGFESWLERSDGFHVPIRTTARAHRDESGRIRYVEGTVEDVQESEGVQRLRIASARVRAVFDQLGLSLVLTDVDGTILDVTPAVAARLDRTPAELVSEPLETMLDDAGARAWTAALRSFAEGAETAVRFETVHGGAGAGSAVCAPVPDEHGEAVEVIVALTTPERGP